MIKLGGFTHITIFLKWYIRSMVLIFITVFHNDIDI